MAKTIKITSSNEIFVVDVDFDDYRAIQKVVGGMFETVKTQRMFDYFGKPVMMLVDEEGILKQLPLNRTGSRFYGYPIVGDFILAVPTYEDEPCSRAFKCQSLYWLWKTETDIC